MLKLLVDRNWSVVPTMSTLPARRFLYQTDRVVSTVGAIARARIICRSTLRTCSSVMSGRWMSCSHSSSECSCQFIRLT